MRTYKRIASAVLVTGLSLAATPTVGADPTEEMRMFARIYATLEMRDLKGYCTAMHGAPYVDYLNRVCQSAVQNNVKEPEACSQERIAQQVKIDAAQCLAMPAAEFEKTALRGVDGSKAFVKKMTEQNVDGEMLLKEERSKLR